MLKESFVTSCTIRLIRQSSVGVFFHRELSAGGTRFYRSISLSWLLQFGLRPHKGHQYTVTKKMATGTFTYEALRTKTLKERIKTQRKVIQTRKEQCC